MAPIEKPAIHQEKKVEKIRQAPGDPAAALCVAIKEGRLDEVSALLGSGVSVDLADRDGKTPLSLAAEEGHTEITALLLKNGATVDGVRTDGATPLLIAASKGHSQLAALLLENGARINRAGINGVTPLLIAAQKGYTELVVLLLQMEALIDLPMPDGTTPLWIAAQNGHTDLAALLLKNGAKVDVVDINGDTPLCIAAEKGQKDLVALLLQNRASVDLARTDGATPLLSAAQNGHTEIASLLLQKGATVDLATANGVTPLHFAAQEGHTALAALLLQKGASVDLAKADGATPLFMAAQEGHTLLAALLLQNGASINQARIDGATPLLLAAKQGHADIVSALILQNKSDLAAQGFFTRSRKYFFATPYVDKTHLKGNAPLIVAIQKGHLAVVSVLVAAGASIDLPDEQNNTPLLQAVRKKNPQIAALLLQAGANSSIKNKAGQSALDLALASSKPNSLLIDLLLESASTRKRSSFLSSAYTRLDTVQLSEQACALLMKLQHADATVQATDWRTFVNALCTKLGLRHIVAEGLVAMLRQMPADWPSVGGGTSKPTAAQVRQFYLHMLASAQQLHALSNQDDPHRAAYYKAQQDMPAVAKLVDVAASQSGQLIGAGQTALGDWAGSLQRFFAELSVANSATDIETQLQNEMGLHPLLATTIAPLWASLRTKSVAGLILAMRKKFNAPEFASTVLEAGDSDVLRFMLIEQLQVLNKLKAERGNGQ